MKIIIALALSIFITGCSTTNGKPYSPPPPPPQDKALVYLMRSQVVLGSAYPTIFSINNITVISMKDKGYFWTHLKPGEHVFSAGQFKRDDNVKTKVNIKSGAIYYIEYTQEHIGYQGYTETIRVINPDTGSKLIKGYTYPQ